MAEIRAAISRSERSVSARRATSRPDRSSASIRRALVNAMAACPAIASRSAAPSSSKAAVRVAKTVSAPNGPSSPTSGAAMTEWMPWPRTYVSEPNPCRKRSSAR